MSGLLDIPTTEIDRELARRSLLRFTLYTRPDYLAGWFHEDVAARLDRFLDACVAGLAPRLMLFAPPRHGKSELASRRFPAYALGKYPRLGFIATSHTASLATDMNLDVQRIIASDEYAELFPETRLPPPGSRFACARDKFEVVDEAGEGTGGVYRCAGVDGSITGKGARVLVVDDPIKGRKEADSKTVRDAASKWFKGDAVSRLDPGGGILIIQTRWHEDDLSGRLLDEAKRNEGPPYEVASYPAIAAQDEPHRREGDALHEARYSRVHLVGEDGAGGIKREVGSREWASLYQQQPSVAEGALFKREDWRTFQLPDFSSVDELKRALGIQRIIQAWDTAHKKGEENDYWACATLGICSNRYLLLDVLKRKMEFPEGKRTVVAQHAKWTPDVVVIEEKASGLDLIPELRAGTRVPVHPVGADADKVARANAITPTHEAGLCFYPENAPWAVDFIDSMAAFPTGSHDDDVDAFVHVMRYAIRGGGALGVLEYYKQQAQAKQAEAAAALAAAAPGRVLSWPIAR